MARMEFLVGHLIKEIKRGAQQFRDCLSAFRSIFEYVIKYLA